MEIEKNYIFFALTTTLFALEINRVGRDHVKLKINQKPLKLSYNGNYNEDNS